MRDEVEDPLGRCDRKKAKAGPRISTSVNRERSDRDGLPRPSIQKMDRSRPWCDEKR